MHNCWPFVAVRDMHTSRQSRNQTESQDTHKSQAGTSEPDALLSKKLFTLLDLCVSSLRRGHANLLCIVPILTDDPRRESRRLRLWHVRHADCFAKQEQCALCGKCCVKWAEGAMKEHCRISGKGKAALQPVGGRRWGPWQWVTS